MSSLYRKLSKYLPQIAMAHDVIMAALSFLVSLYIRLGEEIFVYPADFILLGTVLWASIAFAVCFGLGLYRGIWRYASMNDLSALMRGATITTLIFLCTLFLLTRLEAYPRSVLIVNWFVFIIFLGGPRLAYRMMKDRNLSHILERSNVQKIPVILVGADNEAELFIREMIRNPNSNYQVVGLLDETGRRIGQKIHGIRVMGGIEDLPKTVQKLKKKSLSPQRILIVRDHLKGDQLRQLLNLSDDLAIPVSRIPRLTDFLDKIDQAMAFRPIPVEDLLGRPQHPLNRELIESFVTKKRVLITGAGGSIGSELVRQVASFAPSEICLCDYSEHALYQITQECSENVTNSTVHSKLLDVRNRDHVDAILSDFQPDIVFHAAALKHVPVVEAQPLEGLKTNTVGTMNVADSCVAHNVPRMVMISTDKAINPTNVMGASKRLAELYCQALDIEDHKTQFVTVRFGNVLGSSGSVVPLFQRQISKGGPLTVTDPEITRYFMTIREAVSLVLQAASMDTRKQAGKIYVLDMGEPVKIYDLAKQMIRLAGFKPEEDIEITFTGLRPGEKMYEELFYESEDLKQTSHETILLAQPKTMAHSALSKKLKTLQTKILKQDAPAAMKILKDLVPEYKNGKEKTS